MKVRYTASAIADLADIADYLTSHFPGVVTQVEARISSVVVRIARWPAIARKSDTREDVRVAVVGKFPYRIFYRIAEDAVEILHVHHAARQPWNGSEDTQR